MQHINHDYVSLCGQPDEKCSVTLQITRSPIRIITSHAQSANLFYTIRRIQISFGALSTKLPLRISETNFSPNCYSDNKIALYILHKYILPCLLSYLFVCHHFFLLLHQNGDQYYVVFVMIVFH